MKKLRHCHPVYILTRKHRQISLQSESSILLKPSFDPNKNAYSLPNGVQCLKR